MKIGILTLYSALNYGAYLQAFAMRKVMCSMGHEVEFINIYNWDFEKKTYRSMITKNLPHLIFNGRLVTKYIGAWKNLNVSKTAYKKQACHYDAIVIGSDELWNINNSGFEHLEEFFGIGLNTDRIIAYAPSCGSAVYEDFVEFSYVNEGLKKIDFLSGRDKNTIEMINKFLGKSVQQVLDPTFLLDFSSFEKEYFIKQKYLLVYTYSFNEEQQRLVKEFAERENLIIVSPGIYNSWCDINVPVSPFEFLSLIKNAEHVITNTFHGTVFSIKYNKSFAVFADGKHKIQSLLSDIDLADRNMSGVTDIYETINKKIDYSRINKNVDSKRRVSEEYLINSLKG